MGRGMGKGTDLGNNGRSSLPWTWTATDHASNGEPIEWSSSGHSLRVMTYKGGKFVISDDRGQFLKTVSGKPRVFRGLSAAQIAANVAAGIMR